MERASGTVTIKAENIADHAPYDIVRKMRASVRARAAVGPRKGGDRRAAGRVRHRRPAHRPAPEGLRGLGAKVRVVGGDVKVFASELRGSSDLLRGKFGSTVLGTDNVMMAAVLAEGTTVIEAAAAEPEVADLADFLNAMGAKIEGAGTRRIIIEGVSELHGAEHRVIPDRIEAGRSSWPGAICGKGVTLRNVIPEHLDVRRRASDGGRVSLRARRDHGHHPAKRRREVARTDHGTVSRVPHRHAGADVRAVGDEPRHQHRDGEHFSATVSCTFPR